MKIKAVLLMLVVLCLSLPAAAFADEKPSVDVQIMSPSQVKEYPGAEKKIIAKVTNHSGQALDDMMVYITMADLKKHWTVNLEDYSADQPISIGVLAPGETKDVTLPIRFVYTSNYHLYVTATSTKTPWIYSSSAIPIEIMGNTKIDATVVQMVSIAEPVLLLAGWLVIVLRRKSKKNV